MKILVSRSCWSNYTIKVHQIFTITWLPSYVFRLIVFSRMRIYPYCRTLFLRYTEFFYFNKKMHFRKHYNIGYALLLRDKFWLLFLVPYGFSQVIGYFDSLYLAIQHYPVLLLMLDLRTLNLLFSFISNQSHALYLTHYKSGWIWRLFY